MTCRELLNIEHPEKVGEVYIGGCDGCPSDYGYAEDPEYCSSDQNSYPSVESRYLRCKKCWDREADSEAVEKVMGTINELCDIGNVNAASLDELKQAIYKASGLPENIIRHLETDANIKKQADTYVDIMKSAGPKVLDSGDRTEFPSGAVRDCREGKGRCDLMPLDVVAKLYELATANGEHEHWIFRRLNEFMTDRNVDSLYDVLSIFHTEFGDYETMLLEVAKQFEEGAKKYGDDNWRKGIPVHCYIDSAIRHYLKYLRGDQDEPHDRAFCWNILCCIWTVKHIEEAKENV